MPQIHSVRPAASLHRAMLNRENHSVALSKRNHLGSRLHARALLGDDELSAGEITSDLGQQDRELQGKYMLAVEILVQAVVIIRPIAQQQRCRPALACRMATL